jgi:predicted type IV restriction endonuclease
VLPRLNFPAYDFKVSRDGGDIRIWDALRRAWLPLTPEEWVRQHLVRYLIEECGAPPALVVQELVIPLGGAPQRADVVVHGRDGRPVLLAECKAPGVAIDKEAVAREVFSQAVRYNSVVGARYIVITNGLLHFVRELLPDGSYRALSGFPKLDV